MAYGRVNVGGGKSTKDATATADKLLSGYTAYNADGKFEGNIPSKAAADITPGTSDVTIKAGQYLNGAQTIKAVNISTPSANNILYGSSVTVASNGTTLRNVNGSMPNRGAVSKTITPCDEVQTYTIPYGYHSGDGKITINAIRGVKECVKVTNSLKRSVSTYQSAATSIGDYALFGGGAGNGYSAKVDAYNSSLTKFTPSDLNEARGGLRATTVGKYALFGMGYNGSFLSTVEAYDTSLTKSTPTALSVGRNVGGAAHVGNYALFAGGVNGGSTVDAYDSSLTRTSPTTLSRGRERFASASVGNYALFGGGTSKSAVVDAYDSSLTRTTPTTLSVGREDLSATATQWYAMFAGGVASNGLISVIDAYDKSLTRTAISGLIDVESSLLPATALGDFALFGWKTVKAVDPSLTSVSLEEMSFNRAIATTIGKYAIFADSHLYYQSSGANLDIYKLANF